jgi:hypothetical protein
MPFSSVWSMQVRISLPLNCNLPNVSLALGPNSTSLSQPLRICMLLLLHINKGEQVDGTTWKAACCTINSPQHPPPPAAKANRFRSGSVPHAAAVAGREPSSLVQQREHIAGPASD